MNLHVDIDTRDPEFRDAWYANGETFDLGNGVTVTCDVEHMRKGGDLPFWAEFTIGAAASVPLSLLSSVIYDWLKGMKGKVERVTIERTVIDLDDDQNIRRIVTEKLTKES
jgi:hypothetical protein